MRSTQEKIQILNTTHIYSKKRNLNHFLYNKTNEPDFTQRIQEPNIKLIRDNISQFFFELIPQ